MWKAVAEDVMCLSKIFLTLACNDYSLLKKSFYVSAFLDYWLCAQFYQNKIATAEEARLFRMVISHKLIFFSNPSYFFCNEL